MMRFRYQAESLKPPAPPSLPVGTSFRLRPYLAVQIFSPSGRMRDFRRAVVDSGADDTVFPWASATLLRVSLLPSSGHVLRWHGKDFPTRYGRVDLRIVANGQSLRWPATVTFSSAPLPYLLLGIAGFLEFFDATFFGADHALELAPNRDFSGSIARMP